MLQYTPPLAPVCASVAKVFFFAERLESRSWCCFWEAWRRGTVAFPLWARGGGGVRGSARSQCPPHHTPPPTSELAWMRLLWRLCAVCHSHSTDESPSVTDKLKGRGGGWTDEWGVGWGWRWWGGLGNTMNPFISLVYGVPPPNPLLPPASPSPLSGPLGFGW